MYNKTKRFFSQITGGLCFLSALSSAVLCVCYFIYFDKLGEALKLAIPSAVFGALFIVLAFKFFKKPIKIDGAWRKSNGRHIGLFFLSFAFSAYSFVSVIVYVAIAVGTAIGASLSGNPVAQNPLADFILTLNLVNVFASAAPFITNIITACIRENK